MNLKWRATVMNGEVIDRDRDGVLCDGEHSVGRVRYDGTAHVKGWEWNMYAFGQGVARKYNGMVDTKAEAKSAVEAAYRNLCQQPGARDYYQRHMEGLKWSQVQYDERQRGK